MSASPVRQVPSSPWHDSRKAPCHSAPCVWRPWRLPFPDSWSHHGLCLCPELPKCRLRWRSHVCGGRNTELHGMLGSCNVPALPHSLFWDKISARRHHWTKQLKQSYPWCVAFLDRLVPNVNQQVGSKNSATHGATHKTHHSWTLTLSTTWCSVALHHHHVESACSWHLCRSPSASFFAFRSRDNGFCCACVRSEGGISTSFRIRSIAGNGMWLWFTRMWMMIALFLKCCDFFVFLQEGAAPSTGNAMLFSVPVSLRASQSRQRNSFRTHLRKESRTPTSFNVRSIASNGMCLWFTHVCKMIAPFLMCFAILVYSPQELAPSTMNALLISLHRFCFCPPLHRFLSASHQLQLLWPFPTPPPLCSSLWGIGFSVTEQFRWRQPVSRMCDWFQVSSRWPRSRIRPIPSLCSGVDQNFIQRLPVWPSPRHLHCSSTAISGEFVKTATSARDAPADTKTVGARASQVLSPVNGKSLSHDSRNRCQKQRNKTSKMVNSAKQNAKHPKTIFTSFNNPE